MELARTPPITPLGVIWSPTPMCRKATRSPVPPTRGIEPLSLGVFTSQGLLPAFHTAPGKVSPPQEVVGGGGVWEVRILRTFQVTTFRAGGGMRADLSCLGFSLPRCICQSSLLFTNHCLLPSLSRVGHIGSRPPHPLCSYGKWRVHFAEGASFGIR